MERIPARGGEASGDRRLDLQYRAFGLQMPGCLIG